MPIYEYRCANGHTFETFQSMSEDPISTCVECGATSERVLSAPAVHFKGSGFYTTDYARKGQKASGSDGASESSSSDKSTDKGKASEKAKDGGKSSGSESSESSKSSKSD